MPPRTKIKKEDIIHATFNIVRKEGMEAVNARRIASELNCSVQPIFSNFSNMEDLKNEVIQLAFEKYLEYITSGSGSDIQYKTIGLNYIRLAREEPKLFKVLFMYKSDMSYSHFMSSNQSYHFIEESIMKAVDIDKKNISSFHSKMWFFTHGIATLIASETCTFTDEEIDELLTEEYVALTLLEKYKKEKNIKDFKEIKSL